MLCWDKDSLQPPKHILGASPKVSYYVMPRSSSQVLKCPRSGAVTENKVDRVLEAEHVALGFCNVGPLAASFQMQHQEKFSLIFLQTVTTSGNLGWVFSTMWGTRVHHLLSIAQKLE